MEDSSSVVFHFASGFICVYRPVCLVLNQPHFTRGEWSRLVIYDDLCIYNIYTCMIYIYIEFSPLHKLCTITRLSSFSSELGMLPGSYAAK